MKATNPISLVGTILLILLCNYAQAQSFGILSSGVSISDCNQSDFFNTSGNPADLPGPAGNVFQNANLGVHTQNSGTLILRGAQVRTFRNPAPANVCVVRLFYRIYLQSAVPGAFSSIDLPLLNDCDVPSSTYPSGGSCAAGDQKWERVIPNGATTPFAPVNLTSRPAGNYVLEVYYEATGSFTTTTQCTDLVTLNNGGANYRATFSIQSPNLSSTNPSSCFGNEGSITIGGLVPNTTYMLTYIDDGVTVGPTAFTTNASGQIIVTGLDKGFYAGFALLINGCTTNLFTGIILSDPIFVPTFPVIPPFCAGTPAPTLPGTSTNGMSGTWSPATVSNTTTGTYTFTPTTGQCGITTSITVTVIPRTTPTFPFGTSLVICGSGTVPTLPNTSTNGINGTWSPSVVDNQNSGSYTFTPNPGLCANPTTFTVTVNPIVTPVFSFGSNATICAGDAVPTLSTTSTNGITGTWSPATVSTTTSGTYTFTPAAGQCAVPTTYSVTVNPIIAPTFSFGPATSVCNGGTAPSLPGTSNNGINGTWSPATVSNTASGTYTFTPAAGQCTTPFTLTVTVNPNIVPTFSFGTSASICAGATVPSLPTTSTNGFTGAWSPSTVDNSATGTYTFTPDAGQCATPATFTVTVNPNITPVFSFGTTATMCAGDAVPTLSTTSTNGITGTWSPATVSTTTSGTYTFTPTTGVCAVPVTYTVTVNPIVPPTFSFGASASICSGATAPSLPAVATNGITGTWSPATVSNTASGTYTFTPTGGQCTTPFTFTVTVNPNITPTFSMGASAAICEGGIAPALPTTSNNGITGTWSPATVSNTASGTYTFTPTAGECAVTTTFTMTVTPNVTPAFSFGPSLALCAGTTAPALPTTSSNGISGTWNPATIDNQNSATYIFTANLGQCVLSSTVTLTVTVSTNIAPTFSFGSTLTICAGGSVPTLPTTSTNGINGTWNPSVVSTTASGNYIFTPDVAGPCAAPFVYSVTVNPILTPAFPFGTFQSICVGTAVPTLINTSTNGVAGTWSPTVVDNMANGVYTFTPDAGQCANSNTFTLEVNTMPSVNGANDTTVYDGALLPVYFFTDGSAGTINWTNSDPSIGLAASGTGDVPSFTAVNMTNAPVTATIIVIPSTGGCVGASISYKITVLPLNKDVFVPNVFSPNQDGKNDILYVYGNYIDKVDMRIFNQWGQQIASINNKAQGWDGKHKGNPQPVGVYVYAARVTLVNGKTVDLKGSITLIR